MANIREVAKLAGASIASVSRILSNDLTYKTTPETRQRVLAAAAELHYSPHVLRKRGRASKSIACIINATAEKHNDSYYITILEGIKSELSKYNFSVDYIYSQYDIIEQDVLTNLFKQKIDGIVLMTTPASGVLKIIKSNTDNIVGIDTSLLEYDNVRYNRFEAGYIAMQHLIDCGHKKIAYVGSRLKTSYSLQLGRYDAYRIMMRKHNLEIEPSFVIDCDWQRQLCFEQTKKLIRSGNVPTAFFFASDYMAVASVAAMQEEGKSVPNDFSIIGISDIEEAKYLNPPLTTIGIPKYEIGQIAATTLLSRMNGDTTPPKQIYVSTNLIVRQSVKNLNEDSNIKKE